MFMKLLGWVRRIEMAAAMILLGVIVAVVFAGTVMRYLGAPLIWSEELAQALFVWLALLASDLTKQRAGHFRIDMLTSLLPRALQTVLDITIKLMILAMLAALAWYGMESHPGIASTAVADAERAVVARRGSSRSTPRGSAESTPRRRCRPTSCAAPWSWKSCAA